MKSHSMKDLAFRSNTWMKYDYTTKIITTSLTNFLFRGWENVLFERRSEKLVAKAEFLLLLAIPWSQFSKPRNLNQSVNIRWSFENPGLVWLTRVFCLQGREGLFRVIMALLTLGEATILELDMEGMLKVYPHR